MGLCCSRRSLKRCITSDPALSLFTSYWSRTVSQLVWLQVWHVFLFLTYKTQIEPGIASQQIHLIKKQNKQQVIRVSVHRVEITSHSDCALRSPAGRSHVRRWVQQETLTARACVATLRVPAEKGGGFIPLKPFASLTSPRCGQRPNGTLIFLWRAGGGCVLRRAGGVKPQECSGRFSGSSRRFPAAARPLWRNPVIPHRPGVFVWARWVSQRGSM